jgi:hypothetical protein
MIKRKSPPSKSVVFSPRKIPQSCQHILDETLVVIPSMVRPGSARERALGRVLEHLKWSGFSPSQIEIVSPDDGEFRKGSLITEGAKRQEKKYLLQIDGDIITDWGKFFTWMLENGTQDEPCLPFRGFYRLDRDETEKVLHGENRPKIEFNPDNLRVLKALCAGAFWIPRDFYLENPVKSIFQGWGAEDVEFGRRVEALWQWHRPDDYCVHHWHENDRKMNPDNIPHCPDTGPHTRIVWDKVARQKVAVMCQPRSGSNLLEKSLNAHPDVEFICEEPFGLAPAVHEAKAAPNKVEWLLGKIQTQANTMAFRLMDHHPPNFNRPRLLEDLNAAGFKFIRLVREDEVEHLASKHLAWKENSWVSMAYETTSTVIDLDWAEKVLRNQRRESAGTEAFLDKIGSSRKLYITYESLRDDFTGTMAKVQNFLGVHQEDLKPLTTKQMVRPVSEVVANIDQIRDLVGASDEMPHFYDGIQGWFNYQGYYDDAIANARDGEILVEIGGFKGRSTSYAGVEIANRNPTLRLDIIDHFKGSLEHRTAKALKDNPDAIYIDWLKNTERVSKFVRAVKMDSKDAHQIYEDASLAAVFIDGDHSYEGCSADIKNWLPKVRPGGYIAGHDYNWKGVREAVTEAFPDGVEIVKGSWILKLPD